MQTRKLGNTDLELTTVGLGTWAIGGPWQFGWGPQDDDEAIAAIVGARSPAQIEETAPAGDWSLSEKDIKEIEVLLAKRQAKIT